VGTYDHGGGVSKTEVEELLWEVKRFKEEVEDWLRRDYPDLVYP
jgi:hypothetical protein